MPKNSDEIKASQHDIVFISPSPCIERVNVSRWLADPGSDSDKFLDECTANGWPHFRGPDGTAFVYAVGGLGQ